MPSAFEADHEADMADPVYATEYRAMVEILADGCRTACRTRDHGSYGECLRSALIQIDRTALASGREG